MANDHGAGLSPGHSGPCHREPSLALSSSSAAFVLMTLSWRSVSDRAIRRALNCTKWKERSYFGGGKAAVQAPGQQERRVP